MPKRLILASASPRRKELLSLLGLPFDVIPSDVDESMTGYPSTGAMAGELAKEKAFSVWQQLRADTCVLAADTIVVAERSDTMLGKPTDAKDAARMLQLLSGTTHTVFTGVAIARPDYSLDFDGSIFDCDITVQVVDTQVQFRELTPEMIDWYIATGEPFDKAGAYGIQGHASAFVEAVYGDYFNVVGLPVQTVAKMLEEIGIEWWRGTAALE
jgi:septum formation protein